MKKNVNIRLTIKKEERRSLWRKLQELKTFIKKETGKDSYAHIVRVCIRLAYIRMETLKEQRRTSSKEVNDATRKRTETEKNIRQELKGEK